MSCPTGTPEESHVTLMLTPTDEFANVTLATVPGPGTMWNTSNPCAGLS